MKKIRKILTKEEVQKDFNSLFDLEQPTTITTEQFEHASRSITDKALEIIYGIMINERTAPYVKLEAARTVLAYSIGMPTQRTEMSVTQTPQLRPIVIRETVPLINNTEEIESAEPEEEQTIFRDSIVCPRDDDVDVKRAISVAVRVPK